MRDKVRAMLLRGFLRSSLVLALALPMVATVACGGSQTGPKTKVEVPAGKMPEGGDWHGVFYSQTYGFLHLTKTGDGIVGAWRTVAGDKWGELYGQVDGDVLNYEWKEHKIGMIGPNATVTGRGFFRYVVPETGEAHEIRGEWGLGENNAGHTWTALRQNNQEPDPASVRPDELESRSGAEGWDDSRGDADISTQEPPPAPEENTEESEE